MLRTAGRGRQGRWLSELKPKRHLYLPRSFRREDSAECGGLIRVGIRQVEIGPVHTVECLDFADQPEFLAERKTAAQRDIGCEQSRAPKDVASGIAPGVLGWNCKSGHVEPFTRGGICQSRAVDDVGTIDAKVPAAVAGVAVVRREHRREWRRVGKKCRSRWSPDHYKKKSKDDVY